MKARPVDCIGTIVGVWLLLGGSALGPAYGQGKTDAERSDRVRGFIPREQRERLGLRDTNWTEQYGKVHPEVYKALDSNETPWARPVGYEGTVFVQVHLGYEQKGKSASAENKAVIKQLQRKVLSQISAADFYVEYPFETLPGILGYVHRAGLEKLKAHPDVVAVCLDDKPLPKRPPPVFKVDLPPLQPGDPATQPAQGRFWGSGGKVEREVYQALALHGRVDVNVGVRLPVEQSAGKRPPMHWDAENRVLAALTAYECWLHSRTPAAWSQRNSTYFSAWITVEGLNKLEAHPDVEYVGMQSAPYRLPVIKKRP